MHGRYVDHHVARAEKRSLDSTSAEDGQPDRKRPALASVIVEALKVDSMQKLCSSLEPILRRVVSEEVERALAKLGPTKLNGRSSPKRIEGPDDNNLQLHFKTRLSLPLFTGGKVEGEQGAAIHIVLVDANTGHIVTSGPESCAKLDVFVLEGDFNNEDDEIWSEEEFESHIVKEREGKRPLLSGDLQIILKDGVGTLGELSFTDNSSWIRSRKFRLGLKVSSGFCDGMRIREAKSEAFTVKDHRGELYKKHYPPALHDEVWRLEKIGKDGSFHKRLNKAGVFNVEDFLRLVIRDPQRLRNILGSGMSNKMWDILVEHAKTCVLGGKLYVYYPEDARNVGVVFNHIYELSGLIANDQYHSADSLSESQKVYVDTLVKKAYDNWMHVIEYDGKSLLNYNQDKNLEPAHPQALMGSHEYSNLIQQTSIHSLPHPVNTGQPSIDTGATVGGYHDGTTTSFSMQSQNTNLNSSIQFDDNAFSLQSQLMSVPHQAQLQRSENGMMLGMPQTVTHGFQTASISNSTYRGVEDFFPEEEIRIRSHEMLENEDMQHLLRMFNMGSHAHASFNAHEDGYPNPSAYMPANNMSYNFDDEPKSSSGKAVVGWLKLKAALRWGIFVRKKAADRRAQLIELDDS